jgi:hypothetical protein
MKKVDFSDPDRMLLKVTDMTIFMVFRNRFGRPDPYPNQGVKDSIIIRKEMKEEKKIKEQI